MNRDKESLRKRKRFIKRLIDKPLEACEELEMLKISLQNSRNSDERFRIASELLFLSEQTILNDYIK